MYTSASNPIIFLYGIFEQTAVSLSYYCSSALFK